MNSIQIQHKIDTIFKNSEKSKIFYSHRLLLNNIKYYRLQIK